MKVIRGHYELCPCICTESFRPQLLMGPKEIRNTRFARCQVVCFTKPDQSPKSHSPNPLI